MKAITQACAADRRAVTDDCQIRRDQTRGKANRAIEIARQDRLAIRRAHKSGRAPVLRSEHDDYVEQNLPADAAALWRGVAEHFPWRGVTPGDRALYFMEWLEENPDAITELTMESEPTDLDLARSQAAYYDEAVPF